ncbi:MAG TPA: arylsulfatase [Verrucomicrobiales bacterium]|mgnify:FL=1|nr:arylsulfatase [Verrucomicrobiales bacterium]HCI92180.1 arylsulfatase [Verrucomicrobiales bacterium]
MITKQILSIILTSCLTAHITCASDVKKTYDKPNVVIIYADDVGFGDLGVYGAKKIPTPHLDKLAGEGLRFTDGHCSAATCTPSRFSMLTGIHGFRHGVRILAPNAPMVIKPEMLTLPQIFKNAGYTTAVIGKWHLGIGDGKKPVDWNGEVKPGPLEIGFDYSFLLPSTNDRVPCVYLENHRVVNLDPKDPLHVGKKPQGFKGTVYPDGREDRSAMTYYQSTHGHNHSIINGIGRIGTMWGGKSALWNDETMADEFAKQAKKYLAQFKTKKNTPFFLFWSAADIHVPRAPHPRFKGKSELSYRGDAMVQLDWCAGEIIKALEENGLSDNTIVIFSSDNGPVYDDGYDDDTTVKTSTKELDRGHDGSGQWRGGKYQIYEGGTRVPLIIRWPGKIKPGTTSAMVSQIDFIASFAEMLGVTLKPNQAIDSRNNLNALLGKDKLGTRILIQEARGIAIRDGDWKYISIYKQKKKKIAAQLYNLKTDPSEKNNLIKQHPKRTQEMQKMLTMKIRAEKGVRAMLSK